MYFLFVSVYSLLLIAFFFFFNDTATTEIYTLSLHDALPISEDVEVEGQRDRSTRDDGQVRHGRLPLHPGGAGRPGDRKSTRLNSSHGYISYAVFCLKKKKKSRVSGSPRASSH